MNTELQKTKEQIYFEADSLTTCAILENYARIIEHAETLLLLAKHAQEIKEREAR